VNWQAQWWTRMHAILTTTTSSWSAKLGSSYVFVHLLLGLDCDGRVQSLESMGGTLVWICIGVWFSLSLKVGCGSVECRAHLGLLTTMCW
jgi:hypothetical protein